MQLTTISERNSARNLSDKFERLWKWFEAASENGTEQSVIDDDIDQRRRRIQPAFESEGDMFNIPSDII